jgi:hypothetical protein
MGVSVVRREELEVAEKREVRWCWEGLYEVFSFLFVAMR